MSIYYINCLYVSLLLYNCLQIKSRDVIEAYIQRLKDVNPILNGIVEERFAAALREADKVDAFLSTSKANSATIEKDTPLLGVPITVKESLGMKGNFLYKLIERIQIIFFLLLSSFSRQINVDSF